jgi:mono/diheme cytochrome c family protein
MKYVHSTLLCAVAGLMLVVGCGGDDETGSGGGGNGSRLDDIKALTGNATAGTTVYTTTCGISSCHGPNGNDGDANSADLTSGFSQDAIISAVIDGLGSMPAQSQLSDQQVADATAYVMSL